MKFLLILPLLLTLCHSATLQTCKVSAPDQITHFLPNYTGTVQPCSYSGFAPLDSQNDSALFYWYFPHQTSTPDNQVPLIVWLNGGPGTSSMLGLFMENGPFQLNPNMTVNYVDENSGQSWAYYFNMLFIDQPVDVGFSYTTTGNYPTNEDQVGQNLWTALQYFLQVHPETAGLNWYIAGESYAGKYVPFSAWWILEYNSQIANQTLSATTINLSGIMVGDGLVQMLVQRVNEYEQAYAASQIAPYQLTQLFALNVHCEQATTRNLSTALDICNNIPDFLQNISGIDPYNLNEPENATINNASFIGTYLNNANIATILHVSNSPRTPIYQYQSQNIANSLLYDFISNSSIPVINSLLTQIPCLFYEGALDGRVGTIQAYKWMSMLAPPYNQIVWAPRQIWWPQGLTGGYYTLFENLTFAIIAYAGHEVPYFQLGLSVQMVKTFTMLENNWNPYQNSTDIGTIMCSTMADCNGNGVCTQSGICNCNKGFGFADCSAQAQTLSSAFFTLNIRGYLFLQINFGGADQVLQFEGDNGVLEIFYSGELNGPIVDYTQADQTYFAVPGNQNPRTIYLTQSAQGFGFLTIHNTAFSSPVSFQIRKVPIPEGIYEEEQGEQGGINDIIEELLNM